MQSAGPSLQDIGVLVTRPVHQADGFSRLLQQAGARPIRFPSIEIQGPADSSAVLRALEKLDEYRLVIFISANAVEYGLRYIKQAGKQLPGAIAAIGRSTAAQLEQQGIRVTVQPEEDFNTEALLGTPALQAAHISGQRILIIRGEGGRELLAESLRQRGALVDYAEVYRRSCPLADSTHLLAMWQDGQIQIVTVTSNEALKNLYHILDRSARDYLLSTPLVVPGQRCAELARDMGFNRQILIAENATNQAMLDSIRQWHNS